MKHPLLALLVTIGGALATHATAAEPEVDRKKLKSGLILRTGSHHQLVPGVALHLKPNESATPFDDATTNATWMGYLQIVTPGDYRFTANAVGGSLALELARGEQTLKLTNAPTKLEPGVYKFTATFTTPDRNTLRKLELLWEGPGFRREPIPYFFFGHLAEQRTNTIDRDLPKENGRFLFEELGCKNCHHPKKDDTIGASFVTRTGPELSEIGSRVYPGWLDAWLANPSKLRPHTTMPAMFTEDDRGVAERYAVGQYLLSLGGKLREEHAPTISNEYSRSLANGVKLFTTAGCATCHGTKLAATNKASEDDDDVATKIDINGSVYGLGAATGGQALYALGALGSKTTPTELAKFLRDPLKTNPHGRMPNMVLNDNEARDLARHLCRNTDETLDRTNVKPPKLKPSDLGGGTWEAIGAKLVVSKGCVNCHTIKNVQAKSPEFPTLSKPTKPGCLSEKPDRSRVPEYTLTADQRRNVTTFLGAGLTAPKPHSLYQSRTALKRFNCLNCHSRDGEGGIGTELADTMKKLENADNADDVAPPRLTSIGHKAKMTWLDSVLVRGGRARPWMNLRMPQYGESNVGSLVHGLAHLEGIEPDSSTKTVEFNAAIVTAGRTLTGSDGLGCIKCHDINGITGGGTRGPDLARTAERLRYDWYERWMHNPQRLAPGTKMPQNFNNGRSAFTTILNGDADPQIEALWAYMALGPGLPLPKGMEPPKGLIVKVGERPEVLRTFMPDGAGTRAIAVGYPGGINVAFDAESCRVAYAWEGSFVDASPVWNNRGGAPAKLLGPKFFASPSGATWGLTNSRTPPDFEKRSKDYAFGAALPDDVIYQGPKYVHFAGYGLDAKGNPTFGYRIGEPMSVGELRVSHTIQPAKASVAVGLTQTFTVSAPADRNAWFNVGRATTVRRLSDAGVIANVTWEGGWVEFPAAEKKLVVSHNGRVMVYEVVTTANCAWHIQPQANGATVMLRLSDLATPNTITLSAWSLPRDDEGLIRALAK